MASYSAVDAMWNRGSQSSSAKKTSTTPKTTTTSSKMTGTSYKPYSTTITGPTKVSSSGTTSRNSGGWSGSGSTGSSSSSGSSVGSLVENGLKAAAGLTGSLGSTSQSSGTWGGTNNGQTIGGTMGTSETAMKFNREMMEAANAAAAAEAEKNREWQKMMSDTSFQRAVEDMRKAGINPILAAGTQAPMGSGSAAATHMAAGMPENYTYSTQEGSQWGMNSSYSFNNFAQAIDSITKTLADLVSAGFGNRKEGQGVVETVKEAGEKVLDYIGEDGIENAKQSAKSLWDSFTTGMIKSEEYKERMKTHWW